jgi:glycosyltransferase involved in cell wall biosynthesis
MTGPITHVSPTHFGRRGIVGGGERYPYQLARAMAAECPTRLVTFGDVAETRREGNLEIRVLPTRGRWRESEVNPLSERLPDALLGSSVVHVHQWASVVANFCVGYGALTRTPVFATDHGGYGYNYAGRLRLHRLLTGLLPVSRFSASFYPQMADKTTVIGGGVDTAYFRPSPETPRKRQVLFVGRILPHKGIDVLVNAVDQDLPLLVIGTVYDSGYRARLGQLAEGKPVTFREGVGDHELLEAYQTAGVVVLPSVIRTTGGDVAPKSELFGLTLLEAMACATPVICTDVGGMPEVVDDGRTGYVVPPNDPEALRISLHRLLDDETTWSALSDGALDRASANSWSAVARRCLEAYHR